MKTTARFYIYPIGGGCSIARLTVNGMIRYCKMTPRKTREIRAFITRGDYKYEFVENTPLTMLFRIGSYEYDHTRYENIKQHKKKMSEELLLEMKKKEGEAMKKLIDTLAAKPTLKKFKGYGI